MRPCIRGLPRGSHCRTRTRTGGGGPRGGPPAATAVPSSLDSRMSELSSEDEMVAKRRAKGLEGGGVLETDPRLGGMFGRAAQR